MLRYFNYGPRNFRQLPDVPTKRFNWEFYIVFNGRLLPEPLARKVPRAATKNFWILPPGVHYCWEYHEPIVDRASFQFSYVSKLLQDTVAASGFLALTLASDQLAKVRSLAEEVDVYYRKPTALAGLVFERAMLDLSLLALRDQQYIVQQNLSNLAGERVERAIAWYREHMAECPSLKEVADGTHISASHLRRHFYVETGNSPSQTFLALRMRKASEVLTSTSLTLEEVAPLCGFSSAADFCRVFKKYYKTTPHVWRRKASLYETGKKN